MRVEVAALRGARPLSRIGSWISARMPFVWRTRMFFWIALALGATVVAAGYGVAFDQLAVDAFTPANLLRVWLTGARWLMYGVIFLVVMDTVRRTRPVVRLDHHLRVAGCVAVTVFFASLPPLVFVATLVSQLTEVPLLEAVARPQFQDYLRDLAPDGYDQNVTVTGALVMSLLAGIVAAVFSSSFAPDVLGLMRGGWSLRPRSWRRRGAPLDRALSVRSPILWSSRVHSALVPIAVPPVTLALVSVLPITTLALGYGSAALFIVFLFLSFRSQEAVRFVPLPWRAELAVFLIHAAIISGAALACLVAAPSLGLTAQTLRDNYPGNVDAILLGTLFMASAMQAARGVSSIGVYGIIVAVVSAIAGLVLTLLGLAVENDASFTVAIFGSALLVVVAAAVSVRREMRPGFRRHALSATLFVGPVPALGYLMLAAPQAGDMTPSVGFVSLVIGVIGVALALYATRNPRRALAYTAR
jgi:hypothetical protein